MRVIPECTVKFGRLDIRTSCPIMKSWGKPENVDDYSYVLSYQYWTVYTFLYFSCLSYLHCNVHIYLYLKLIFETYKQVLYLKLSTSITFYFFLLQVLEPVKWLLFLGFRKYSYCIDTCSCIFLQNYLNNYSVIKRLATQKKKTDYFKTQYK